MVPGALDVSVGPLQARRIQLSAPSAASSSASSSSSSPRSIPNATRSSARQRAVADDDAAGVADGVAQRHGPEVLDGEHECRAAVRQVVEQSRRRAASATRRRVGIDGRAELGAGHGALARRRRRARPAHRPRTRSSARWSSSRSDTLSTASVVAVAHHEHGIDDPDLSDVAEPCQLLARCGLRTGRCRGSRSRMPGWVRWSWACPPAIWAAEAPVISTGDVPVGGWPSTCSAMVPRRAAFRITQIG